MNCRDFERNWNELFDASSVLSGDEHVHAADENEIALLREHAAACPICRRSAAGYQILHRAIIAWGSPPDPPVGLTDRIVAAAATPMPASIASARMTSSTGMRRFLLAAAAAILAAITGTVFWRINLEQAHDRGGVASVGLGRSPRDGSDLSDPPRLNEAVASATEATWDLARSASEPAARLSRQFLDAATEPEAELPEGSAGVLVPLLDSFAPDSAGAAATIQQVSDHFASGVRPISSTARQAFGFLLGPTPPKAERRDNPPAARGA
jgi:hypothetical protein